jgi:hypothetical protein
MKVLFGSEPMVDQAGTVEMEDLGSSVEATNHSA